jgi:SPP1 family predicted phage head-tail adaptor
MRAGELRQRITIEEQTITHDEFGAEVVLWENIDQVWAAIDDGITQRNEERFLPQAGQRIAGRLTQIKIRWRDGITVKMRISHGGQIYQIERIERDPTLKRQLILHCSEVNP